MIKIELNNDDILDAGLDKTYELLGLFRLEIKNTGETELLSIIDECIDKVKNGIDLKFNIMNIITENYEEDLKNQIIYIPNKRIGQHYKIEPYLDELENRKNLAKQLLLRLNAEDRFFKPYQK